MSADGRESLILSNGRVWTSAHWKEAPSAVGIVGNRICAVGTEEHVRGRVDRDARVIDVGGRSVLPGFVDPHQHYLSTAEAFGSVNVRYPRVTCVAELVTALRAKAVASPKGSWIRGFGLDWSRFPSMRPPNRHDLDQATSDHPVVVFNVSGHHAIVNTRAIETRGITDDVQDPPGGRFDRENSGRLSGVCFDAATDVILPSGIEIGCHGPNFHVSLPGEDSLKLLEHASHKYAAAGLTTVCDAQVTSREMRIYQEARRRNLPGPRLAMMPLSHQLQAFEATGIGDGLGDDWLRVVGLKLYSDGALTGGTAAFFDAYKTGGPHGEVSTGSTYWSKDDLTQLVGRAVTAGWRVGIHAQGDRGIEQSVAALEEACRSGQSPHLSHRIEHCGAPTTAQLERMTSLGAMPISQPNFLWESGDTFLWQFGQRATQFQPLRTQSDVGLPVILSSDSFVSSYRPLETICAAVTRDTRDGQPIGVEHRLSVDEAIHAHTVAAAESLGMDATIGSLEVGKLADVVVLDEDLESVEPARIRDLSVRMTVLDGEIVYSDGSGAESGSAAAGTP